MKLVLVHKALVRTLAGMQSNYLLGKRDEARHSYPFRCESTIEVLIEVPYKR